MANGLTTDVAEAVNRGLQFRQAEQLRPLQLEDAQLGLQRQQQQLTTGGLQQQAAQQGIETEEQRAKSQNLFNTVARLRSLPDGQKLSFIQQNIRDVESRGGDSTESRQAEALIQKGNFSELNEGLENLHKVGVQTGFLKAGDTDFTLSEGQRRFSVTGKEIAAVAPKVTKATQQVEIPPVLLEGLDPAIAPKAEAAFKAAGGGKDGLKAFQSIIDKGTEQQRRLASPSILKSNFPQASRAEQAQLQGAMDAAKTTESGLKSAQKVRAEQRRLKKAAIFQDRALQLLDNILASGEGVLGGDLGDVLGSIEGSIDFRLFSDDEAQIISDIKEAGNILTADNLDLMTGVLSQTDIEIIANLSGGALDRKRTKARFVKDVTELRDRLASQKVVTIDERDQQDNGVIMQDAQGNRARVFKDGRVEEL